MKEVFLLKPKVRIGRTLRYTFMERADAFVMWRFLALNTEQIIFLEDVHDDTEK